MAMATHYFTFGQSHTHPETGEPLKDYWIEIVADSSKKAMAKMFDIFGLKWSFQYPEHMFTQICWRFPKGCYAHFEIG